MNNLKYQELCLSLLSVDTEEEVIELLSNFGFWSNEKCWKNLGENENNFSIIGAQQKSPDTALVEKIVNSVDAVLMNECLKRGIDPESTDAPQSIEEALDAFFNIRFGKLSSLPTRDRAKLAENIQLIATGTRSNPSYTIIDKGEGQTPKKMSDTILSLNKSNKLRIPFVQGRFNMGGTGALRFCGKNNLQLIISKRNPEIVKREGDDGTSDYWSFTVVRRVEPTGNMRNSVYKYLTLENEDIINFYSECLPALPNKENEPYKEPINFGTIIKLYEYKLERKYRSLINFQFYNRLSLLLTTIALPVKLIDCRNFQSRDPKAILFGLSVRLEEDKRKNLEDGFPASVPLIIDGEPLSVTIYAFKKENGKSKKSSYATNEGIIFTINGQYHGHFDKRFFKRNSVSLSRLTDYILVVVDCSRLNKRIREDLFMNSRDRLSDCEFKIKIEHELEDLLKNHQGLKELKEKRKKEELLETENDEGFENILQEIVKSSPTLTTILIQGNDVKNPYDFRRAKTVETFEGKEFPTFFNLMKEYPREKPRKYHKNSKARIQFETDVDNNYFTREKYPGRFQIYIEGNSSVPSAKFNLWNGVATLNILLPDIFNDSDIVEVKVIVTDPSQINAFENVFYMVILPEQNKSDGGCGIRKKPINGSGSESRLTPSRLKIPKICEVKSESWDSYGFNEESAIKVFYDDGEYVFYINMHNKYFQHELKYGKVTNSELLKKQFKYSLVLISLALLSKVNKRNTPMKSDTNYDTLEKRLLLL